MRTIDDDDEQSPISDSSSSSRTDIAQIDATSSADVDVCVKNPCLCRIGDDGDGNNILTGYVEDTVSGAPIGGMTVEILDNQTGTKTGNRVVTAEDGSFMFEGLDNGLVGLGVMAISSDPRGEERIDTFTFNIPSNQKNRRIRSTARAIYEFLCTNIATEYHSDRTLISGGVYYHDEECNEYPVDCAEIENDFNERLIYVGETGLPDINMTETSENGRFMMCDFGPIISGATTTLDVFIKGEQMGSTTIPLIELNDSTQLPGNEVVYSTHIIDINVQSLEDPTPDCLGNPHL